MRLFVFVCLLGTAAFAQTYGGISGTIFDPTQSPIAGASVTVTSISSGFKRSITSTEAGTYTIPFLPPGEYEASANHAGFKTAVRRSIQVQVDLVTRVDFNLEVGQVNESVEVVESVPLLNSENASVGTVIENKRIVELPLNGRNYLQMVALSPNVSAEQRASGHVDSRQGGDRGRQPISIAGQRQFFNRFTLDGVENTDVNYNTYVIRPSIEALEEFKVQTGIYSAEFGRATSQINATTRRGGNSYHGALFHFLRNDGLDAKEWAQTGDRNPFRRNQYGFVFTGKVIPDKLFFMSNFEGTRDVKSLIGFANVAPTEWRRGDFSNQTATIFDPATRTFTVTNGVERATSAQPFPGNIIPANRLDPIAQKLLEFYPEPTRPGANIVQNFTRNRKRNNDSDQFTQRFDFNESPNSQWFGRLSVAEEFERRIETFEVQEGGVAVKVWQFMAANTRVVSPNIVNETRFGYNIFNNDLILHFANRRDVGKELGIAGLVSPPANAWGTPAIQLGSGLTNFGESGNGPWIYRNRTLQALNNLSIIKGKHNLKMGGEVRRDIYNAEGNTVARGRFFFQGLLSIAPGGRAQAGNLFADLMLGLPQRSERALGVAQADFRAVSYYGYFEDTWKLTPKLTLNLGLRYEFTPAWTEPNNRLMNIQMFGWGPNAPNPIMTRPGRTPFYDGVEFRFADVIPIQSGDQHLGPATIRADRNDFAPRIGIAWAPSSRWTIRTGAGVFYTQDQGNPRFDIARNLAGRGDFTASDQRPNSTLADPWRFERQAFTCSGWSGQCVGQPFVLGNNARRITPYVTQWLFNMQRQFGNNTVAEIGYLGNIGRRLERLRSTNEPFLRTGPADTSSVQSRRPFPIYGIIQQVDNVVNSNYHALAAKLTHRFSSGLTLLSGYTWAKAIDDSSGIRTSAGDQSIAVYDWDLRRERGLSQFHTAHRFVNSALYEIPFPAGAPAFAKAAFGGWQFGGILTLSTGNPVRVSTIGDTNAIGGEGNYPDATGISPFLDAGTAQRFWNIDAFSRSSPELSFRFGNVGRNVLLGPGYLQLDGSMLKNIRLPFEGHSLQFRWEVFNATNRPNWNVPASDIRNPNTFGLVTTARTMREMQFALKYLF